MNKKLYRSRRDRKLFGVCGGLAEWLNVDATLVRVLTVITILFTGVPLFLYFVLALVVPKEPLPYGPYGPYGHNSGNPYGQGYDYQGYNNGAGYTGPNNYGTQGNNYGTQGSHGQRNTYGQSYNNNQSGSYGTNRTSSELDSMMEDIEKKAMKNEIENLREQLARYEKGDK